MELLYDNEKLEITPEYLFELVEKVAHEVWAFIPELSDEGISFYKSGPVGREREIEIVNGLDSLNGDGLGAIVVVPLTPFASRVSIYAENNDLSYHFMRSVGGFIFRTVMEKDPFSERFAEEAKEKMQESGIIPEDKAIVLFTSEAKNEIKYNDDEKLENEIALKWVGRSKYSSENRTGFINKISRTYNIPFSKDRLDIILKRVADRGLIIQDQHTKIYKLNPDYHPNPA